MSIKPVRYQREILEALKEEIGDGYIITINSIPVLQELPKGKKGDAWLALRGVSKWSIEVRERDLNDPTNTNYRIWIWIKPDHHVKASFLLSDPECFDKIIKFLEVS